MIDNYKLLDLKEDFYLGILGKETQPVVLLADHPLTMDDEWGKTVFTPLEAALLTSVIDSPGHLANYDKLAEVKKALKSNVLELSAQEIIDSLKKYDIPNLKAKIDGIVSEKGLSYSGSAVRSKKGNASLIINKPSLGYTINVEKAAASSSVFINPSEESSGYTPDMPGQKGDKPKPGWPRWATIVSLALSMLLLAVGGILAVHSLTDRSEPDQQTDDECTYIIEFRSVDGTSLGSSTITRPYGTVETINAPTIPGYLKPEDQLVKWDSKLPKTIIFTYGRAPMTNIAQTGVLFNGPDIVYSAVVEYRNRTADLIEVRVVWTSIIAKNSFMSYAQQLKVLTSFDSSIVEIVPISAWKDFVSYSRSATGTTDWMLMKLDTTDATTENISFYYKYINDDGQVIYTREGKLEVNIPAY